MGRLLKNKTIRRELEKGAVSLVKKIGWLIVLLLVALWIIGRLEIFSLPAGLRDALGLDRQTSSSVQSIVAGELQTRAVLAESTRDYTGNALFERQSGILNCAGEEQAIKDGQATARATVAADNISYSSRDGRTLITIQEAQLDSVNLDEELEIVNKRNPCVRLVQIFGDVTSENEVRTLLKDEITEVAKEDTQLYTSTECAAVSELEAILSAAGADTNIIDITIQPNLRPQNNC